MPKMNDITNTANLATLGFLASKTNVEPYWRIAIALAYTSALMFAFKRNPIEERNKIAVLAAALITLSIEFTLDYYLKTELNSPFIVACLLLLNVINSRLNFEATQGEYRLLTIQEEYEGRTIEDASVSSGSSNSFANIQQSTDIVISEKKKKPSRRDIEVTEEFDNKDLQYVELNVMRPEFNG